MKVYIYTFSGTGNTFLTADFIAESLTAYGHSVLQKKIESAHDGVVRCSDADHIIIGYPIHAFNAPKPVVEFAEKLPESSGTPVSLFKVSGEPFSLNDASSHLLINAIESKGYQCSSEKHFLMPYNVMFRYPEALAKQMYLRMQQTATEFAGEIINGTGKIIPFNTLKKVFSFIFRIQWWGARFNGRLYSCRHKKCIMCLKCVNSCPSGNISVKKGRIKFDGKCLMCMRCVQNCPVEAINIGILRFWAVRGKYDYEKLSADDSIPSVYVEENTRGYFRLFRKFFAGK